MQAYLPERSSANEVDVALPLHRAARVDVHLPLVVQSSPAEHDAPNADVFQPSLSQAAADVSVSRVRWPNRSRSGYHGGNAWNWMRDGRADFGERSLGGL